MPAFPIDSSPEDYYAESGGLLFTELMNKNRIMRVYVDELDRLGLLRGHKIGIVDSDLPADKPAVDGGLIPALRQLGYTVTHRSTVSGDPSTAASQMPVEVQQMQAAGVKRRTEGEVVHRRQLFVDARDEIVFNCGDRQGAGGDVGPDELFVLGRIRRRK